MSADIDGPGGEPLERILDELHRLRDEVRRDREDLWEAIEGLHDALEGDPTHGASNDPPSPEAYRRMKRRLRRLVSSTVPPGGVVAVVSRGDPHLLDPPDRVTRHYPSDSAGGYLGFYPPDGTPAVAHLEWVRSSGVDYLLFPATAAWWFDAFPHLARHLERTAAVVGERDGVGRLYHLEPEGRHRDLAGLVGALASAWERSGDAPPSILDWTDGCELADALPGQTVFAPPMSASVLPYLDRTVDIVVVGDAGPARLAEAERVATRSVVRPVGGKGGQPEWVADHVTGPPPAPESLSIVIPTYDGIDHLRPCLRAIDRTLQADADVEAIVVDDGSGPETSRFLAERAAELPWLRVVRNASNLGFIGSCNRGAAEAGGRILVFLNDDTVPLEGWLTALLRVFDARSDAGAVGGRLVYPDGRLQEAGGVVYLDGSGANVGRGDWDPDAPMYTYVRPVDYCSGALLATHRSLFADLGGFDPRYLPAYYEDTDYCFAVREAGLRVYYQPEATVVHLEGATSGTDPAAGAKRFQRRNRRTFRKRWRAALRERREPPDSYDQRTWIDLTLGDGQ